MFIKPRLCNDVSCPWPEGTSWHSLWEYQRLVVERNSGETVGCSRFVSQSLLTEPRWCLSHFISSPYSEGIFSSLWTFMKKLLMGLKWETQSVQMDDTGLLCLHKYLVGIRALCPFVDIWFSSPLLPSFCKEHILFLLLSYRIFCSFHIIYFLIFPFFFLFFFCLSLILLSTLHPAWL